MIDYSKKSESFLFETDEEALKFISTIKDELLREVLNAMGVTHARYILATGEYFILKSAQFEVAAIFSMDLKACEKATPIICHALGMEAKSLLAMSGFGKGYYAYARPMEKKHWTPVEFDKNQIVKFQPVVFIGKTISGEVIRWNLYRSPHGIIMGKTGAGKTEALRAIIYSLLATGMRPIIDIVDIKGTNAFIEPYINRFERSRAGGVALFASVLAVAEQRKSFLEMFDDIEKFNALPMQAKMRDKHVIAAYTAHPDWFHIDPPAGVFILRPMILVLEELPGLITPDPLERAARRSMDKDDPDYSTPFTHESYLAYLTTAVQLYRSVGLTVLSAAQYLDADTLPSSITAILGMTLVLQLKSWRHSDVAFGTQPRPAANALPPEGGCMYTDNERNSVERGRCTFVTRDMFKTLRNV